MGQGEADSKSERARERATCAEGACVERSDLWQRANGAK